MIGVSLSRDKMVPRIDLISLELDLIIGKSVSHDGAERWNKRIDSGISEKLREENGS